MRNGFMIAATSGIVLLVGSLAFAANAAKGKAIYDKSCATCHGAQGKGNGPASAIMDPKPADFTSETIKKKSDEQLLKAIESGVPGTPMAPWKGSLTAQQIQDVLAYVRSFGQ
jgi:mono/diheme cytochrome c family protein